MDLKIAQEDLKMFLCDMSITIDGLSYEVVLNMPINDRDLMIKAHNKKIKKQQSWEVTFLQKAFMYSFT